MTDFGLHSAASAPEASKPLLERSQREYGMVPNLHAVMAESPAVLEAYQKLNELFMRSTSLSPEQQTVVWQTISVENCCHYCVPAHTGIAKSMRVPDEIIEALRDESPLPDPKLEALRAFTLKLMRQRGVLEPADLHAFLESGYNRQQVLEVVLGISQKVMSNYINAIARTPLDAAFEKFEWHKA